MAFIYFWSNEIFQYVEILFILMMDDMVGVGYGKCSLMR